MGIQKFGRRPMLKQPDMNYMDAPSTGTKLTFPGVYNLSSTAALKTWILQAPRKNQLGQTMIINCLRATTTLLARVNTSACSFYSSVGSTSVTRDAVRFNRADMSLTIMALTTAKVKAIASHASPNITTS
jgi:hypothetical protein